MARSKQWLPAGQSMHAVAPLADWCLPATHALQTLPPSLAVSVPGSHGVAAVAPVSHAEPAGQGVHSPAPAAPPLLRYVPAAHSRCVAAPSSQNEPGGQLWHMVAPLSDWNDPAAQRTHASMSGCSANEPAVQLRIGAAPPAQKRPASHAKHVGTPSASDTLPYVPGGQLAGSSIVALVGQNDPGR